ncbi:Bleomycin hydrolase [Frankliniella fusca]|uniref:Bleomycin hydrolase n=1 Tax=Frankliniella fusca TaxID=407009 RepID=A0AAE1LBX5_9NEOP|nr:Bleomycin hydrolase [Frankliniella fusca]
MEFDADRWTESSGQPPPPGPYFVLEGYILKDLYNSFYSEPKNILAQNVCTRHDPLELAISRRRMSEMNNVFTHKIEVEGKPVTNQKNSGQCWLYACLNTIRIPFMNAFNLSEFEFSQAHLFFWDKVERANHFLHSIIATAGQAIDDRTVCFLLADPINDGGQWDMMVNLITKYGLIPKKCFPESFSSECTVRMNNILKSKLREYAHEIRSAVAKGADKPTLQQLVHRQMMTIFRIIGICLGVPPTSFTWEYYHNKNNYASIGPITPLEFYEQHVRPLFDVKEKVCLVTDPRETSPYNNVYNVQFLNNVVGGKPVLYNNQPIEVLEQVAAESIKQGEAVWFGCEVLKRFALKLGVSDLDVHDYEVLFGTDVSLPLTREERLLYHDSAMTHAMVFTGVSLDGNGRPTKWRVQNSWGEDRCDKGYITMSAEWFRQYVFEVTVDKKYLSADILAVFEKTPIVLPPWDPMGVLTEEKSE